jgi:hypothetical protein
MAANGHGKPDKSFISTGFRDWKHATGTTGVLLSHNNSYSHKQSVVAWEQFRKTSLSGTVVEQLGNNRAEMIKNNRLYLQAVSDVILTCCKQDIALRGHRETPDSINKGNFLEILSLLSRYNSVVEERIQRGPKNGLYTSHDFQNTIINVMAGIVRKKYAIQFRKPDTSLYLLMKQKILVKMSKCLFLFVILILIVLI